MWSGESLGYKGKGRNKQQKKRTKHHMPGWDKKKKGPPTTRRKNREFTEQDGVENRREERDQKLDGKEKYRGDLVEHKTLISP